MRDLILAMRAIWDAWNNHTKLDYRGESYSHTLMTPFFDPGPNPYGNPKVFLAAVGERMTEVAGEVADGLLAHGFTTERYLREVTIPSLERGLARGGRTREHFEISCPVFVVTGTSDEARAAAEKGTREQIAFYASTPAYRGVLEHHGWGDLQPELTRLSKEGKWKEMGGLIDDDVVRTFAAVGDVATVARELRERWDGVATRISFYTPYRCDDALRRELLEALS
jgi:probable F420-dependent oxidoreductase